MSHLIRRRMALASSIAHSRKMIQQGYHPEFFKELLIKLQVRQKNVLRRERIEDETYNPTTNI